MHTTLVLREWKRICLRQKFLFDTSALSALVIGREGDGGHGGAAAELQQLSPAQLRELLSASGHGQLLRDEAAEEEEKKKIAVVDEQLVAAAKDEGNAFFRQGQMQDAVAAYSRCGYCSTRSI